MADPITVGELIDVPAPQSPINAQFLQEVANRIQHRYPNLAALNGWTTALIGTRAVTYDTGIVYQKIGAGWARQTPRFGSIPGFAGTWEIDR